MLKPANSLPPSSLKIKDRKWAVHSCS